jgi:uncharacterized protein
VPDPDSYGIATIPTGVTISVYVAPRSSSNKVVGVHNGAVKIALTAPPVEGAANKALVEFIARVLNVPRASVSLVSGEGSRRKLVRVNGIGAEATLQKLISDA